MTVQAECVVLTMRVLVLVGVLSVAEAGTVPYHQQWDVKLASLDPEEVLSKLDLARPGLEAVKAAAGQGDRIKALGALLDYYRRKYPLPPKPKTLPTDAIQEADRTVKHVFQWGPYEAADYGETVNWEWDPRGDIEWVAAIYRFYWAPALAEAYVATRDEQYPKAFVELTADWIAKHPLDRRNKAHPVYKSWKGFAWLDIQTGIRATQICGVFPVLVHGKAFTPEFLGVLLASMYDHQVKTERIPMGIVHNKAIFEQRGFVNIAYTFPEFRESKRWVKLALERAQENLLAQTTPDGVQREWSGGYHVGVLRDAVEMAERASTFGIQAPKAYHERIARMFDYIFWIATPDLGFPMFGDCGRSENFAKKRSNGSLYSKLLWGTQVTGDPKYAARAELDLAKLPRQTSFAFSDAGMYAMRSKWGPDQVYMALHCSPPALTGHDQQDNGTFELCALGRWLMTDSGYYTYGHDERGRAWHRQTKVHQTLTLDGKNTQVAGKELLWHTCPEFDALVVENASYPKLRHRRSVWFVGKRLFVLLDEAIGEGEGRLDLHFQMAPGDVQIDQAGKRATTRFDDANVLVWSAPSIPVTLIEEEGWFAWSYGKRKPRTAFALRHERGAPAVFVTVLLPYRGRDVPEVSCELPSSFVAGADRFELTVRALGQSWRVGRDLKAREAWCGQAAGGSGG
ncbi:MAG: alginate lyase family protein [Phycisphaerae bacterium]|nr:alginate lyase family protein [Phycisphaerae bacterium]